MPLPYGDLSIGAFRGLRAVNLFGCTRVNVLVGGNNSGKTPRDGGKMVGPHRDGGGATHPHQDFPAHRIGPRAAALPPFARRALPSRAPD